ncbi:MAG: histidine kinase, partial [Bacteroidota bacterium]
MKTFFLYRPLFRLLTPVLMGSLAYLLLLLVNNNVAQLTEEFLSNELYFCWGVCLLMQETNRLVLRRQWAAAGRGFGRQLLRRIVVAYVLGLALVSVAVWAYFRYHLGYAPDRLELLILLGIFGGLGWVQMLLYGSQQYVHQSNEEQLLEELE